VTQKKVTPINEEAAGQTENLSPRQKQLKKIEELRGRLANTQYTEQQLEAQLKATHDTVNQYIGAVMLAEEDLKEFPEDED
jgi:septal ring factor EnvC (AmiA/AmiB activator)